MRCHYITLDKPCKISKYDYPQRKIVINWQLNKTISFWFIRFHVTNVFNWPHPFSQSTRFLPKQTHTTLWPIPLPMLYLITRSIICFSYNGAVCCLKHMSESIDFGWRLCSPFKTSYLHFRSSGCGNLWLGFIVVVLDLLCCKDATYISVCTAGTHFTTLATTNASTILLSSQYARILWIIPNKVRTSKSANIIAKSFKLLLTVPVQLLLGMRLET